MRNNKNGSTDIPASEDQFEIKKYIDGLTKFIVNCNTPLTVAIQGDWGTGKTSVMTMVKNQLKSEREIECVWFNTWQFSQFNMSEQLPMLMMSKLICSISSGKGQTTEKIRSIFMGIAGVVTGYVTGGGANGADIKEMFSSDFVDQIDELKNTFQRMVKEKAGEDGRVVIFVDDLDRLQPGKAVELLEVLKIFLDCVQCVFVLAIDYGVVCRGVKEKYGEDFSDEKGRRFFDKIIQVPFKMPVANYNIKNYIRTEFRKIELIVAEEKLPTYELLIRYSIGNNPRGMKRLFNSFLLLKYVADEKMFRDAQQTTMLFALLCMQSRFEEVYNYLIENRLNIADILARLMKADDVWIDQFKFDDADKAELLLFSEELCNILDTNGSRKLEEEEIKLFETVLSFSVITANNTKESMSNLNEHRWRHKVRCRRINDLLNEFYANEKINITFVEWYNRKDKGTWWGYFQNEKANDNLKFGYEYRLDPKECDAGMRSKLTIAIYSLDEKKMPIQVILKEIGENPFLDLGKYRKLEEPKRLWYREVYEFDTLDENADEEIVNIIKRTVNAILPYIV